MLTALATRISSTPSCSSCTMRHCECLARQTRRMPIVELDIHRKLTSPSNSAQFVASFSPNAMAASVLYSSFFSFVIIFNGVVQPVSQLPYFWRYVNFHVSVAIERSIDLLRV